MHRAEGGDVDLLTAFVGTHDTVEAEHERRARRVADGRPGDDDPALFDA